MPRLIKIVSESQLFRKRHVPSGLPIQAGAGPFRRQKIIVLGSVHLHTEPPLFEIIETNNVARLCLRFVQRGKNQRHQNGNDRNRHEQFDQAEPTRV